MPVDPFSFDLPSSPMTRAAVCAARPFISRLLGLHRLQAIYSMLPPGTDDTFADRVIAALDVSVDSIDLAAIPPEGPVIVAATHPRGALDGLVMATLLRRVRPDARLIANYLLARIPELHASCFFVDPFGSRDAGNRSGAGLRASHLWLRRGGALVVFPAGEVAHRRNERGAIVERQWSSVIARLASATGAAVVHASIDGRNSRLFYAAGRIHPILRTALLPRELLNARGERVTVTFGRPLASTVVPTPDARCGSAAAQVADEIAGLPDDAHLVDGGRFQVFCSEAHAIPATVLEIGRLRALTYRAAGEGAAADVDLDRFDDHYLHLFVWDRDASCVVGAYRLGQTDRIVETHGLDGLYTRTLFRYSTELLARISPALELGRSFVRVEYQRNHQALLLLWRGIGAFIVRHPHYRMLFGPVSISGTYCDASHALLASFLEQNHLDASLARLVEPRHPRPSNARLPVVPHDERDVDRLVAGLESDGKGMPVLLRQYLKLNARALGFSVDPDFGHVLDALMTVELPSVDRKLLRRYLGDQGAAQYLAHHDIGRLAPAA